MKVPSGFHAHRGYGRKTRGYWDNSIEAIECARSSGFKVCEIDVHISRDRIPVVVHDPVIGEDSAVVGEMTASQLKARRIATLSEVIHCQRPDILNIELKYNALHKDEFAKVLQPFTDVGGIYFSSFDPQILEQIDKKFLRAWIIGEDTLQAITSWDLPYDFLHIEDGIIDEDILRRLGSKVVIWTVNDLKRARELKKLGVLAVITDDLLPEQW